MNENSEKMKSNVYQATKWSAITNIMGKIIPPITNLVLARLLTPEAFGIVASINIVISFAEIFTDAGFQKYLIQHDFDKDEDISKTADVAFLTNFGLAMALWVVIILFRDIIADMVGSKGYGIHLAIAATAIPIVSLSSIQQALFKRKFDFKSLFLPRLINSFVPLFVTIPLAYFARSCWALIIGTLLTTSVDAIVLTLKSNWKPHLFYDFNIFKKMFSFSAWTLLESISIWLTVNIDIFIIGRALSNYHLGLYKGAFTSLNQIMSIVTATITPVLFATLSRYQSDKIQFKNTVYSFQNKAAILLVPMGFGMFAYKELITWILLGEQWMEIANFLGWLGLVQSFTILIPYFASEIYRAQGQPRISFVVQLVYILFIAFFISSSTNLGFESLCNVRILLMLVFILEHIIVLQCKFGFRLGDMLKNLLQPIIAAFGMYVVGWTFNKVISSMYVRLFSILVCVVVYFGLCLIMPSTRKNIKELLNKNSIRSWN